MIDSCYNPQIYLMLVIVIIISFSLSFYYLVLPSFGFRGELSSGFSKDSAGSKCRSPRASPNKPMHIRKWPQHTVFKTRFCSISFSAKHNVHYGNYMIPKKLPPPSPKSQTDCLPHRSHLIHFKIKRDRHAHSSAHLSPEALFIKLEEALAVSIP